VTHYKKHLRPARPLGDGPNSLSASEYAFDASILTFATSTQASNVSQNKGEHVGERTAAGSFNATAGRF
jgi:hypothetical protein